MPHLTAQQATEQYKVSIRTLRTLISGLTPEQKAKYLIIKGKQHLISTELLNQHYKPRTGAKVQPEAKRVQTHNTTTDRHTWTETHHHHRHAVFVVYSGFSIWYCCYWFSGVLYWFINILKIKNKISFSFFVLLYVKKLLNVKLAKKNKFYFFFVPLHHKKKPTDRRAHFVCKFIKHRFPTERSFKIVSLYFKTPTLKHIHKKQRFFVYRFRILVLQRYNIFSFFS
jgi:hypothetical protein